MKYLFSASLLLIAIRVLAQGNSFEYGQISYQQFDQTAPSKDSSAAAVVLKEFGEASLKQSVGRFLVFEHHYVIKILKQAGVDEGNITIPLLKFSGFNEELISVKATSYNIENNGIQPSDLDSKNIFTENTMAYADHKKFIIPNVRVGSIIEVMYTIESPFYARNFKTWKFQSHLPKLSSEYWATVPGNYTYHIGLKGFLPLTKNEIEIVKNCFDMVAGSSDCVRYKFAMQNIPAFQEEDFMTAKSNYLASINFELKELKFGGSTNKITTEWKDADKKMLHGPYFGKQLKKGKAISQKIEPLLLGITDTLKRANIIYGFIKSWYTWNDYYGYSSAGIKKAFDNKSGNIADINLSLIAALRNNGFDVEPLILSTRDNGLPTALYPVLSDFNYVVAKLNLGRKVFLLDASDSLLSFGMLPERCLNGQGRVFPNSKPSYWYDLTPTEKYRSVIVFDLVLQPTGVFTGTIQQKYYGYQAYKKREYFYSFGNQEDYLEDLKKQYSHITINKHELRGVDDFNNPITEKFEVEIEGFDNLNNEHLLLNPFFLGKIKENPFRSNERLYPIDYGAAHDANINISISYPSSFKVESIPDKVILALPNSGARFLFDVTTLDNKLLVTYSFKINKPVFSSEEYYNLKELYNMVIQTQNTDFVFKKK